MPFEQMSRSAKVRFLFSAFAFATLSSHAASASLVITNDDDEQRGTSFSVDWAANLLSSVGTQVETVTPETTPSRVQNTATKRLDLFKINTASMTFESVESGVSVSKLPSTLSEQQNIEFAVDKNSSLEVATRHALGPYAVTKTNHLAHASLRASDAWDIEADAIWNAETQAGVSYKTAIGIYSNRQPFLKSRGGVGLADPEFWLQQFALDAGMSLETRDEKFSVVGGLSFSEAGFERHFSKVPWLISLESQKTQSVNRERSLDSFVSVHSNLIDEDRLSLDMGFHYSNSASRFRSAQQNTIGGILFPGDYFGAQIEGGFDELTFQVETSTLRSRSYDLDSTNLNFSDGVNRLDLSFDRERLRDNNLVVADDEIFRLRLRSDLAQALPNLPDWAPDELQIGVQSLRSGDSFYESTHSVETRSFGGGFAKHGERFYTDIYAFVSTRSEFSPSLISNTNKELGLDIIQELYLDDFDFSAYVSINNQESRRGNLDDVSDRNLSGGVSISYAPTDAPSLTLSADLHQDATDFFFDEFSYRSHEYSIQAEAQLLHLFQPSDERGVGRGIAFNLSLNAYHGWSGYREGALPITNYETRALVRLTKRF
ncbi:MAG: hypothetical protein NXH72_13965 [Hyphomonadaceae bacterium]|nr:hypothetical protein [Hyphomonadaceae bacterium]